MSEGSRIASFTVGSLPGGNITVNAQDTVELIGTGGFVETLQKFINSTTSPSEFRNGLFTLSFGLGNAGDIEMNTSKLIARDGFFVISSTLALGQGGSLNINASDSVQVMSSLLATGNRPSSVGSAGNLTINTRNLILSDGAVVSTATAGIGRGGTLTIDASESVDLQGGNSYLLLGLPANTNLTTSTLATGDAGDLRMTTKKLTLRDGATVSADTFGFGQGGILDVQVLDSIQVIGQSVDGLLSSALSTRSGGSGTAGDAKITAGEVIVQDGASISATSLANGNAGNLEITARSVQLDNRSTISATTVEGERGNINLSVQNFFLRRGSSVTTNATGSQATGGNINIDTNTLVALDDSDISANSANFRGGQVIINASGIVGIQFRDVPTFESDITATGANPEFSGTVEINTPDVDPVGGLVALPTGIVDASNLIASGCTAADGTQSSEFIVTGRGGLPPSPDEPLSNDIVWSDTRLTNIESRENRKPQATNPPQRKTLAILPATGWIVNDQDEVTLISHVSNVESEHLSSTTASCVQN